jgi:thiol:disulfide interchange protein DsbD
MDISMRFVPLFLCCSLMYGWGTLAPAAAQLPWDQQLLLVPEVKAQMVAPPLAVEASGPTTLRLAVEIPPNHHGYLDAGDDGLLIPLAFTFPALVERGVQVVMLSHPAGVRDVQVRATVLRGAGEFVFRLDTQGATFSTTDSLPALLRYQICNDITKVCYPPQDREIPLHFASAAGREALTTPTAQTASRPAASLTMSERVTTLFQRSRQHVPLALVVVFAAGLLASATPCVYPLLPVTSAILLARGRGSRRRGLWHTVVYCLGIVFFYAVLGWFAATTGTALSIVMTSAWVNLGFALVFAYFGLSMLGLYEFPLLSSLATHLEQATSQRGGLVGTFLMGSTAGLGASPCIGPVVGAILLEITGQTAEASGASSLLTTSGTLRGMALMTSFGVGLGLPFLVVGLLSHWLGQPGPWLTKVKFVLGLPILYVAYMYYLKSMDIAGVLEPVAHAMLLGVVAIGLAMFIGDFYRLGTSPSHSARLRGALGIVLLVVGIYFLYNGLGHSGILISTAVSRQDGTVGADTVPLRVLSSAGVSPPQEEIRGNLRWFRDFALAQEHARREHKPLFVDFYATWCANCKAFDHLTRRDARLNAALQQVVLVKIYDTDTGFRTFQRDPQFPELGGVGGQPFLPLFAIYTPQGEFAWKGQNYEAVETMVTQLEQAKHPAVP